MLAAIVLGMGLPTTAAYIMLATAVVPALVEMGVPLLTAHMFVFFYGCVAAITPPVALASYVAAAIAQADMNRVGWTAFRFGLVAYALPIAFFFGPALLAVGTPWAVGWSVLTGSGGVFLLSAALVGYFRGPLNGRLRAAVALAGCLCLADGLLTDLLGAALIALLLLYGRVRDLRLEPTP
jgi:TRAP-type uncharacterized transport system fused permease subunit